MVAYEMHQPLQEIAQELEALEERLSGRIGEVSQRHHCTGHGSGAARAAVEPRPAHLFARGDVGHAAGARRTAPWCWSMRWRLWTSAWQEVQAEVSHDALPAVMADPAQLLVLFQNLVSNSIDYRGDEAPRIHIGAEPENGMWRFSVQDNGIGIAPENAERVFDIFEQLHAPEDHPGKGMGLAICRKIVTRHGGRIWVESQPGAGATFYFTLPRA